MDSVPQAAVGSLLRPKLTAPQAASDSLCRPQVLEALAGHPNARLVLFSAPAGSGKTTALHVLEDMGYYCVDNLPLAPRFHGIDDDDAIRA